MNDPTKEQWLKRCAARFQEQAALDEKEALYYADACLEYLELSDSPEDAADDEMSCWEDDGGYP